MNEQLQAVLKRADEYFGISKQGSTVGGEIRAGVTTFLTMAYILFVNP
ncbi:MAG: NCS2 family permease, partial [Candidatus Poseidoniia archaeon]|nr:NCS2 family permease [Candidatus Poseidoniia archaeon]